MASVRADAVDLVAELGRIDKRIKAANVELRELVTATGAHCWS